MKQGWEIKKLGEVCVSASSNVSQNKLADDEGEYPIFGASGLIKKVSFYHRDKPYLSIVKDGSGVGRVTKMDAFTSVIGTLQYILPKENIDLDYLNYSLMSVDFKKYVAGAAIPHIYFKDYKNEPFLWMPLPEQQRIVSILDEAFAAIDKAKANAEQNLKNAKELFESYLQGVFEKKGEGWEEKTLGEACKVERGSSPRPIDKYFTDKPDSVNWIKIGDTKEVDKYIYSTRQKITKEGALQSRFVDIDDFILSNSMSFGKPYIMKTQGYIHDGWFVLRLPKNIDTEFFWYLLASPYTMNQFISLAAGAIVKNISGDLVKKTILPIPPLKEQQTIVQKLDALSAETKKLEAIYQQKIADLEELKKSILQKAFAGELKTEKALTV
jgi:type I restriction enzyme S subunit